MRAFQESSKEKIEDWGEVVTLKETMKLKKEIFMFVKNIALAFVKNIAL